VRKTLAAGARLHQTSETFGERLDWRRFLSTLLRVKVDLVGMAHSCWKGRIYFRIAVITAVLVAVVAHLPLGFAAYHESDAAAAIRAVLDAQATAWNRGDIDGYMNGYARGDATEFVGGDTMTRGWQTVRDRYAKKYDSREKMGTLTFSEVEVQTVSADAALVTGRWALQRKEDQPHGRFTLLFRKLPEGWRIVHDHTSAAEK
jgi:ketosteroid isomerase-like protein